MPEQRLLRSFDASVPGSEDSVEAPPSESRWMQLAATMARGVRRQCPAWLSGQAEDIARAALIKVMAVERRAEEEQPLSSFYLHRAAHSALVDEIRRRKRPPEIALVDAMEPGDQVPRFEPRAQRDPQRRASFRELGTAVRDCLLGANRDRRLAVTLYLQGHSLPEVAGLLGWGAKRTDNLVSRGLADLRQCLMGKRHKP